MEQAEEQLRQLALAYTKLRQELIPVFKMSKERLEPLPNVPGYHVSTSSPELHTSLEAPSPPAVQPPPQKSSLSRTLSLNKKGLFLGSGPKNHSPTHIPSTIHEGKALSDASSLDPSAAAIAASNNLSMSYSALPPTNSPSAIPQPSPTSPLPYQPPILADRSYRDGGVTPSGGRNINEYTDETRSSRPAPTNTPPNARDPPTSATSMTSNISSGRNPTKNTFSTASTVVPSAYTSINGATPTAVSTSTSAGSAPSADTPSVEIFKSFRVGLEDPCHKVLPAALRKYNIQADWRQYALYIVYGDQERCVDLDEKPLALFKDLDREGKKPMFMLRKLAPPTDTPSSASVRPPGPGLGGVPGGVL
jgi:protein STE50